MIGCAEPGSAEVAAERPSVVAASPGAAPRPATASAPNARTRPEFLARDNACRRATAAREAACASEWTDACDQALLTAAYASPQSQPTTGACYYHDRAGCPECACDYYVKVHKQGFDGGTGCLGTPEDVLTVLYGECAAQRCESR